MSAVQFHELSVKRVSAEAAGSVAITFDIPPAAREAFRFEPGQYLTLRALVDGQDLRVQVSSVVSREYTRDREVKPSTSYLVKLSLKNLN